MTPETIKNVAETAALLTAAVFFLYKVHAGYFYVGLAIFVESERRHLDDEKDRIVVTIRLKKSGTGTIQLHDAQVQFFPVDGPREAREAIALIGLQRKGQKDETIGSRRRKIVDWDSLHADPRLQLAPGDETQFACHHVIPAQDVCVIELTILGQARAWVDVGEYKASCVSLPVLHPRA
jgi:hypothetical protein